MVSLGIKCFWIGKRIDVKMLKKYFEKYLKLLNIFDLIIYI